MQAPLKTFRDHNRWLFVNEIETSETDDPDSPGQTFTLSPVAVLWESEDPDEEPIRATASSAVVRLSTPIALLQSQSADSQMGRIVAGRLTG